MNILAFESSCDENSVALVSDGKIIALETRTQDIHQKFGGVVPELAGRSHLELIDDLCERVLEKSNLNLSNVDLFAATAGPGLIGSLLVGFQYAQGLSVATGKPFRPIHHMEAHLWSPEIEVEEIPLPFLILLASGGHTLLVLVRGVRDYELLGTTLDDALGEAYDKVGKMLGLSFPAGAEVDKLSKSANAQAYKFPISMQDDSLNFSFSGLKTSVLHQIQNQSIEYISTQTPDLLASFQESALSSVMNKIRRALKMYLPKALCSAGGVSANSRLRELLSNAANENNIPLYLPSLKYCADNAAMIGYVAEKLERAGVVSEPSVARPRWPLSDLCVSQEHR